VWKGVRLGLGLRLRFWNHSHCEAAFLGSPKALPAANSAGFGVQFPDNWSDSIIWTSEAELPTSKVELPNFEVELPKF
jgi:hypothetical protein